jgi:hypothetical protein
MSQPMQYGQHNQGGDDSLSSEDWMIIGAVALGVGIADSIVDGIIDFVYDVFEGEDGN